MTAPRLLLPALLLVLGAATARAQEARAVRDEWWARFHGAAKAGWGHERIEERPGATPRFVIVARSWTPVGTGRIEGESRTETDATGRVLRRVTTSRAPWGTTTSEVTVEASGVRYRVKLRGGEEREGVLDEEPWSGDVVELLVVRGEQPPGKRTLRILDIPGAGAKDRELELTRVRGAKPGWTSTHDEVVTTRTPEGRLVDVQQGTSDVTLFAASEAAASDLTVTREAGADADKVTSGSLSMRRPGPEWHLQRKAEPAMVGAEHPDGVGLMAMALPVRYPAAAEARLALFDTMRQRMNERAEKAPTGDGPRFGAAAPAMWRGHEALRCPVEGTLDMVPARGEAYFFGLGDLTVFVLVGGTGDLPDEQHDAQVRLAVEALDLGSGATGMRRHQLGPLSLEVPQTWTRQPSPTLRSPAGASVLNVVEVQAAARIDLHAAQDRWVENQRSRGVFSEVVVEHQDVIELDGRSVHRTSIMATLTARPQGMTLHMRAASCALFTDDGRLVEVVIAVSDADTDMAAVDRILASIRWGEEH